MADEAVSKANIYSVLAPPVAANVSKANIYAVLSTVTANPIIPPPFDGPVAKKWQGDNSELYPGLFPLPTVSHRQAVLTSRAAPRWPADLIPLSPNFTPPQTIPVGNYFDGPLAKKYAPPIPIRRSSVPPPAHAGTNHYESMDARRKWPDPFYMSSVAYIPSGAPPPSRMADSAPIAKRYPQQLQAGRRGQQLVAAPPFHQLHEKALPKKYPEQAPNPSVIYFQVATTPVNLAQMPPEYEYAPLPKRLPGDNLFQSLHYLAPPSSPTPIKRALLNAIPKAVLREVPLFPNIAVLPLQTALYQQLQEFEPQGIPKRTWPESPTPTNIALQPLAVQPAFSYQYPAGPKRYFTEDAASPNIATLPIPPVSVIPIHIYYEGKPKTPWPEDAAPFNVLTLPMPSPPTITYDYPAVTAKRYQDPWLPTNVIQNIATPPPNVAPPFVFENRGFARPLIPEWLPPFPLFVQPVVIYLPSGFVIVLPYRTFDIAVPYRAFTITLPARTFTISIQGTSGAKVQSFDVKDPAESWPLTYNMAPDLFNGETLTGNPAVTVTLLEGADPNPAGILNGAAGFDQTSTQVIQPVTGGVNGCDYEILVQCPTTNPEKILALAGRLSVRR